jgi:hypothetical protein
LTSRSVEELDAEYVDPDWRAKFVAFTDLMELLGDCTISDTYVIADELNAAIRLSEAGQAVQDKLTRKEKVNAKDARLMCALTLGHDELLVDIDGMDIDKLAEAIHLGIQERTIRFPFIYGRTLYDAYADLFEGEKEILTNEETLRLLDNLPSGVFQYGQYTVGPFGLQKSVSIRSISSSRRVPAYHCAVPSCQSIHPVALQTGNGAAINKDRDKITAILQSSAEEPSEWWAFAAKLNGLTASYYGDRRAGVLLPLIGDTLSDSELRNLIVELFDNTKGELRKHVSTFLEVHSSHDAASNLDRAQLLQVCLMAREESLSIAIDRLVHADAIHVPLGDVRRSVMNRGVHSGAFNLRAELGHFGVRFVSDDPGLALLRERRLLRKLYLMEPEGDAQELEWQLRGVDIEDLNEKLEHFFHTKSPEDALRRLVLARKSNMITACHELGIENDDELADEDLIATMLWKLGFPIHAEDDPHSEFWQRHERLWALTQSSTMGTSERFLEAAAPYFTRLEGLLLDSLAFTTWALLSDHTGNPFPFTYDDDEDRNDGLALLDSMRSMEEKNDHSPHFSGNRVELMNLMEGFRTLASHLDACRAAREQYARPEKEFPEFDGKTDLKSFLLRSTLPFLDLSRPSQDRIIAGLTQVTTTLVAAGVNQVRNDHSHYRRTAPDVSRVEEALEAIRQSVTRIENLGFCRLLYSPSAVYTDRWGQRRHEFVGPRSYEHVFIRPTTLDWMGLPRLERAQHLVRSASFGDPNEVLRFTQRYQSEFSKMWEGFPNRRRRGPGTPAPEEVPTHQSGAKVSA